MLDSLPRPVVIAHRGASAHAPENTLSAFKLAIDQGADVIEFDVQLSSDKSVVVYHDHSLERTTDGVGYVKDQNLDYLKSLNAGKAYGPAFDGEKIPTLDEVFQIVSTKSFYNIELKNSLTPFEDLPSLVLQLIKNHNLLDNVLISSFNPFALIKLGKQNPHVRKGLLLYYPLPVELSSRFSIVPYKYQTVHINFSSLRTKTVKAFQGKGNLVFSYTLNHPGDIRSALAYGIDGFFTDDPALARRTLQNSAGDY